MHTCTHTHLSYPEGIGFLSRKKIFDDQRRLAGRAGDKAVVFREVLDPVHPVQVQPRHHLMEDMGSLVLEELGGEGRGWQEERREKLIYTYAQTTILTFHLHLH